MFPQTRPSICNSDPAELALAPGENVLEVYVVDAALDRSLLGAHDTTFVLFDFFEFETQTSPFAAGTTVELPYPALCHGGP